ncbi:MAG: DUF4124 domain-containing protein [Luteimonas sp.]
MRLGWALLFGAIGGIALAWWLSRDPPAVTREKQARAERAAAASADAARPVLYRWHDANGALHITDRPPKGRKAERIDMRPRDGIEVDGSHR